MLGGRGDLKEIYLMAADQRAAQVTAGSAA
jgi:hypothetical protein